MNNPCAFPSYNLVTQEQRTGMTLRDYFAGQALAAVTVNCDAEPSDDDVTQYAETSYRLADAMLKAREE